MIQQLVDRPGERDPAELRQAYLAVLADAVEDAGRDAVVAESGVDAETVDAVAAGEAEDLPFEAAAALVGAAEGIDGDAVAAEARDELLMGMTTAVLDVDTIAANVGGMSATGIQQRLEGRTDMTLGEFATLQSFIAGRQR